MIYKGEIGQIVEIYQDPITRQKPEGKARLKMPINIFGDGIEYWSVEFTSDPGYQYPRGILFD